MDLLKSRIRQSIKSVLQFLLRPLLNDNPRYRKMRKSAALLLRPFRLKIPPKHWLRFKIDTGRLNPLDINKYNQWIEITEPDQVELNKQNENSKFFSIRPQISLITPVFNPGAQILSQMIESVIVQTYDNWQLCLVDGDSQTPGVKETLTEFARKDPRIVVKFLKSNLGISGNSNEALRLAQGEYIFLLDHDDILSPEALFQVVKRINEAPATDILYFDEDKLSIDGIRKDPFFKPDWSPELLLSVNYLTHAVIRRSLVVEAGGFNPAMDGAQDWDLILRCSELSSDIQHIPRVLYHWRQVRGSTAEKFSAKSWALKHQQRCIQEHLIRSGHQDAKVTTSKHIGLRVEWAPKRSSISIVIPSKDNKSFLQRCLQSILRHTDYSNYEIIIVDNNSRDPKTLDFYEKIKKDSRIQIVNFPDEFNFSSANNLGARHAEGDFFLFLNNDTKVISSDWLEEMVRWAENPEIGVVGAKLLYPWNIIQHAGVIIGMEGHASHIFWGAHENYTGIFGSPNWYRNYSAVTGACMLIPRKVFEHVRGFDERYKIAFGDVDICLRIIEDGYRIVYSPFARLIHYEGRTRGDHIPANDILVGYQQMKAAIEGGDPYYNPNLSYNYRIPVLAHLEEESRSVRIKRIVNAVKIVET